MMDDLKQFTHGQEGTHYACDVALQEGSGCCACNKHVNCVYYTHEEELSPIKDGETISNKEG